MSWDWWYYNKFFSVGGPMVTLALALSFMVTGQIATSLCLLIVAVGEVIAWFYRWIEWREPVPRGQLQHGISGRGTTSSAFRR